MLFGCSFKISRESSSKSDWKPFGTLNFVFENGTAIVNEEDVRAKNLNKKKKTI